MSKHLTPAERDRIAQLQHECADQREIAAALGRSPATISRELRRNRTNGEYLAAQAQQKSEQRRKDRKLVRKMDDPELNEIVRMSLAQEFSPDEISGRLVQQKSKRRISAGTIYTWIKRSPDRQHWAAFLRRRGKRPARPRNKAPRPEAACIRNRPKRIEKRLRLGDFEGDTVLGPPGTGGLVTLVCRKSRLTIMAKIKSKDSDHVHEKIKQRMKDLAEDHRHSITFDNGTEFARCYRLEKHLNIKLYFADPGRPYQRGTNENTNGLIRQYFPKGTDFRNVTHDDRRDAERRLNNRPRRCLGYQTPAEVFFEKTPPAGCD
jgi:IS30 family transposase